MVAFSSRRKKVNLNTDKELQMAMPTVSPAVPTQQAYGYTFKDAAGFKRICGQIYAKQEDVEAAINKIVNDNVPGKYTSVEMFAIDY